MLGWSFFWSFHHRRTLWIILWGLLWLIGMQIRSHKACFLFLSNNSCPFSIFWPTKKQKDQQTTNKPPFFSKPINLGMSRSRSMPAKTYHPPTWQSAAIFREQRTPRCFMNFPRKPKICSSKVWGGTWRTWAQNINLDKLQRPKPAVESSQK